MRPSTRIDAVAALVLCIPCLAGCVAQVAYALVRVYADDARGKGSEQKAAAPARAAAPLERAWWPMPNSPADAAGGAPNPEAYTDNADGTVTDNVTGLMWQRASAPGELTQGAALAYCRSLSSGNHKDWRLPRLLELASLLDPGTQDPSIDPRFLPGVGRGGYWTSSARAGAAGTAWFVSFREGYSQFADVSDAHAARCVRQTAPERPVPATGLYAIKGGDEGEGETVVDSATGLVWQRAAPSAGRTWAEASAYCRDLELRGARWRLPTMKELMTLLDLEREGPAADTVAFPDMASGPAWSATAWAGSASRAWTVDMGSGTTVEEQVARPRAVRCVSSGPAAIGGSRPSEPAIEPVESDAGSQPP